MLLDFLMGLSGLTFLLVFILALIFLAIFPLWMIVHAMIRTVKMWPEENAINLVMIALIVFTDIVGAVVYYFVCYRAPAATVQRLN